MNTPICIVANNVLPGGKYRCSEVGREVLRRAYRLDWKESSILTMIIDGLSAAEIADRLNITRESVVRRTETMMRRLLSGGSQTLVVAVRKNPVSLAKAPHSVVFERNALRASKCTNAS